MIKAMMFIDGTYLFRSIPTMAETAGEQHIRVDYKRLGSLIKKAVCDRLGEVPVDMVRMFYFGTTIRDRGEVTEEANNSRQHAFFRYLQDECRYEVRMCEMRRFAGIGFRPGDDSTDTGVAVDLASTAMHYAAVPGAFDVAVVLAGSQDYTPLLARLLEAGKRTMLVGARATRSHSMYRNSAVQSLAPLLLDEHLEEIRLVYESHTVTCEACGKEFETTYWARGGEDYYCEDCRVEHSERIAAIDDSQSEQEVADLERRLGMEEPVFADLEPEVQRAIVGQLASRARVIQSRPLPPETALRLRRFFGKLSELGRRFKFGYIPALDRSKNLNWEEEETRWRSDLEGTPQNEHISPTDFLVPPGKYDDEEEKTAGAEDEEKLEEEAEEEQTVVEEA